MTPTLKDTIIAQINNSYALNGTTYYLTKRYGKIPLITANLKDHINLFYYWPTDHKFIGGFGALRTNGLTLELSLLSQLDDHYPNGYDVTLGLVRAIVEDLQTSLDGVLASYDAYYVNTESINDIASPLDKQFLLYTFQTRLHFAYHIEEGV